MKRTAPAILACVVFAAAVGSAAAETKPASTKPAATKPAATKPAATKPAATKPAASAQTKEATPQVLLETAAESFVVVQTWYKKDTSEPADFAEKNWRIGRLYSNYVDKKRPQEQPGIVLDAKGHVLIADEGVEDRFIDRIVVRDAAGASFPARRVKLLHAAAGILLKVDAQATGKLKPLKFAELKARGARTELRQATLRKHEDKWQIHVWPLYPAVNYQLAAAKNVFYALGSSPAIIADADGSPVGCALGRFFDLNQQECLWAGADLLKAEGIDWAELNETQQACRKKLTSAVQEVVLTFRSSGREQTHFEMPTPSGPRAISSGAAGREISTYGLAISETEILVPTPLDRRTATLIDKIYVEYSPRDRRRAEFLGAYKDFTGFVVRLQEGKLPAHVELATEDPKRMKPFWVARARKKFGEKHVDLTTNRFFAKRRGYAGKYYWHPAREIRSGFFMIDSDGRLAGLFTRQRIEHEEELQLQRSKGYYRPYSEDSESRIFMISEIRDALRSPPDYMDPKIRLRPPALARRRAWFGVEYVGLSSDLAEELKLERPTKDGQLGFLVNAVYAGSPAEKYGVKVGDILLKLKAPGMPYPIELTSLMTRQDGSYFGGFQMDEEDTGPLTRSWKNRRNFLTSALDAIGTGKKVSITYYRPAGEGHDKTVTLDYTIELAPADFDSAPKWKNRKLGLTVKDVTYEIRHALNLKQADAGVVIAKVEPGSPALIARIFSNEIITRLDGRAIGSARQMRDLIGQAHKAGKEKVRLTILRLGKTRFADLTVKAYDPADDEGLTESDQ